MRDCSTQHHIKIPVIAQVFEGMCVVTNLQQFQPHDDIDTHIGVFSLFQAQRIQDDLFYVLKIPDIAAYIENLEGNAVNEIIIGLSADTTYPKKTGRLASTLLVFFSI
jgi:hypothetical protein